ncbi:hypothetical protein [Olleya namhaensis]|uniref:Right handed beta helix region n=1 Tax=Olleya namhaensis TaxID=1144750 RepID=A0A1I3SJT0_9FLAO|nr:hypothetical protein [Olleya namhaensis]SFJ58382.1 hypothetical protein SAMN05443431_11092 [Olleya namhaensis]
MIIKSDILTKIKSYKFILILVSVCFAQSAFAQTPTGAEMLGLNTVPTTELGNVTDPIIGSLLFNPTDQNVYMYTTTGWRTVNNASDLDGDSTNELNTTVILNGLNLETSDAGGTISTDLSTLTSSITQTVTGGNIIAMHTSGNGDTIAINETNTTLQLVDGDLEYTKEDGTKDVIPLSASCAIKGTRAQIIAMSGSYDEGCHYIVTDAPESGTLLASVISLHAVSPTSLSMDVSVLTDHDTHSWGAIYDIGTNQFKKVYDNLFNEVTGVATIKTFPFGNTAVQRNTVKNSVFDYTAGSFNDNEISDSSITILSGTNNNNVFKNVIYNQQGSGTINFSTLSNNCNIRNGDVNIVSTTFTNATVLYMTGSAGSIAQCNFNRFYATAAQNIVSLKLLDTNFSSYSSFSSTGAALLSITRNDFESYGRTSQASGTSLTMNYGQVRGNSYVDLNTGTLSSNELFINNQSYIRYDRSGASLVDNMVIENGSYFRMEGSSTKSATNNKISTGSNIRVGDVSLLGNTISAYSNIAAYDSSGVINYVDLSGSTMTANGVADLSIQRATGFSYGRFLFANAASVKAIGITANNYGYFQVYAGKKGAFNYSSVSNAAFNRVRNGELTVQYTDTKNSAYIDQNSSGINTVNYSDLAASGSRIYFENSATDNLISQVTVRGSSYVRLRGTTNGVQHSNNTFTSAVAIDHNNSTNGHMRNSNFTSSARLYDYDNSSAHYFYYCNANSNGEISQRNNTGETRFYSLDASSQSIIRYTNSSGNYYYSAMSAYYYQLTSGASGTKSGLFGIGRHSNTIANPIKTNINIINSYIDNF